jgi:hypothetical protein
MEQNPEKPAQKAKRLREELEDLEEQIEACEHDFADPVHATREVLQASYRGLEGHGSDPIPVYDYYHVTEWGWERTCKKCGYTQYTNQTKPVVTDHKPDFEKPMRI